MGRSMSRFAGIVVLAATAVMAMAACSGSGGNPANGLCNTPGQYQCADSYVLNVCSTAGNWVFFKNCQNESKECMNGSCQDATTTCSPGDKDCKDDTKVVLCNGASSWEVVIDCATYEKVCREGECVAEGCTQGTNRCNPTNATEVQICRADGEWSFYRDCSESGKTCDNGMCGGGGTDGDTTEQAVDEPEEPVGDYCDDDTLCTKSDEYCFKKEEASSGVCLKYCDLENNCSFGYTCSSHTFQCVRIEGFCTSGGQCMAGRQFCDKISGQEYGLCKAYCYLMGESCPVGTKCCTEADFSSDCSGKTGKCIATNASCSTCYSDFDCGDLNYCDKIVGQNLGCCKPKCYSNDDCPAGLVCRTDGRCGAGNENGDCGGACPGGYVCDPIYDECVLNCPACGPLECCDAFSAPNCYTCECINPTICGILLEQCCFGYSCSAIVYGVLGFCI